MENYSRELRTGADIRRKDNRFCGKNEESTRESWSSIEEGSGENEMTSRQRKERNQRIKERKWSYV